MIRLSILMMFVSLAVMVAASVAVGADDVARVRTGLESESPVWVGQETSFHVELLSSTFFSGSPRFDLPELPGVLIIKTEGRAVLSTETIDGESWSVQRHQFRVYSQRVGKVVLPPFAVRFSVAPGFGKPPQEQRMMSEAIEWDVKMPPGAEGYSLLISTSELEATQSWTPSIAGEGPIQLTVGDAVTRQIKLVAGNVPGMALPAIVMPTPETMSAYAQQPEVKDRGERGELVGERADTVTFVCERAGQVELPSIVVPWWDTDKNELRRITLPGVSLEVSPLETAAVENGPAVESESSGGVRPVWLIALVMLLGAGAIAFYYRDHITQAWSDLQRRRAESESAAFAAVSRACRNDDPVAAYNAVMRWLDKRADGHETATIDAFVRRHHEVAQAAQEFDSLQRAAIDPARSWSGNPLLVRLVEMRRRERLAQFHADRPSTLPNLNP